MDSYSRAVAYLKVLLPLAALVLMSTMFLISRGVNTDAVIPFAQKEIEDRMKGQQVTAPFFSGTTAQGDEIMVTAALARPGGDGTPAVASDLSAEFDLAEGGRITLKSESGTIHPGRDMARFTGNVTITSADGLIVETEELNTALSGLEADSPGSVRATGPIGELTAGKMRIGVKTEGGPIHMLFKNGVKLLYDPQKPER
ncbi:LPS export ABC transporter periplasmic protein LptC [Leisingera sp. F5]|uniref:LPS export ABC transporter periplasmic protein LptC n=1 Tax=Leisingera sp. F5 TaxID=1813816 RepID=UPI000A618D2E|nr:LPS export ABC transporter periplasmic protein LptC [Leisingera sp. F5]